jgi:hypothetical protein
MAVPGSSEARLYYRCARHRHEDALVLQKNERTTGAVYLAGYGVECIIKALILEGLAPAARKDMLESFRGARAHDYEWLRTQYRLGGGARFPKEINEAFTLVQAWSTDMRYMPQTWKAGDADAFLAASEAIIRWADGRL